MSSSQALIFAGMIFGVVFLISLAIIIPTVSANAQTGRKVRNQLRKSLTPLDEEVSLVRDGYQSASETEEPGFIGDVIYRRINSKIRHAGRKDTVKKIITMSLVVGAGAGFLVYTLSQSALYALAAGVICLFFPYYRLCLLAKRRLNLFEAQLPEALNVMSRALKVGHPFNETLKFVSEEMDDPLAEEFGRVFSDMNFGMPSKVAFNAVLERVPSVSLQTLITAVLIQQESGGALAEILEKVADVLRGRFKLQRKLRSLSAEGRMSAWVLTSIPFALAGLLMVVSPDYLPVLLTDPLGQKLLAIGFGLLAIGAIWIKYIINIKV